jgi:ATP-dependent Clp protease ATP-binding subunit ClpX
LSNDITITGYESITKRESVTRKHLNLLSQKYKLSFSTIVTTELDREAINKKIRVANQKIAVFEIGEECNRYSNFSKLARLHALDEKESDILALLCMVPFLGDAFWMQEKMTVAKIVNIVFTGFQPGDKAILTGKHFGAGNKLFQCGLITKTNGKPLALLNQDIYDDEYAISKFALQQLTTGFAEPIVSKEPDDNNRIIVSDNNPVNLSATDIYKHLNQHVIGQDRAIKTIAGAVAYHDLLVKSNPSPSEIATKKSNVLLYGPTGSGKTFMLRKLSEHLGLPYVHADLTSFTQSGFYGRCIEEIVTMFIREKKKYFDAKWGIIFLDEVDKLAGATNGNTGVGPGVGTIGVQQELLQLLEGQNIYAPKTLMARRPNEAMEDSDISSIIFILGGAFNGLENIVAKRMAKHAIGFGQDNNINDDSNILAEAIPGDFIQYGILAELMGRVPVLAPITRLADPELHQILRQQVIPAMMEPLVKQGHRINITLRQRKAIVDRAIQIGTGARGLRGEMQKLIEKHLFNNKKGATGHE